MKIIDISNYLSLNEFHHLKILACFSKAIYCIDNLNNEKMLCFTPEDISVSSLSIRTTDFQCFLAYCMTKMHTNTPINIQLTNSCVVIDECFVTSLHEINQFNCYLPKNKNVHIGLKKNLALYYQVLNDQLIVEQLKKISSTGLGRLLPILLNFDKFTFLVNKLDINNFVALEASSLNNLKTLMRLTKIGEIDKFGWQYTCLDKIEKYSLLVNFTALHHLWLGTLNNKDLLLSKGLALLIGHGEGLTPSGDDFVIGFIAGLHYLGSESLLDKLLPLINDCKNNTNRISRAFLQSALEGYFSTSLMNVITSFYAYLEELILIKQTEMLINSGTSQSLKDALLKMRTIGHSSGVDALIGALFAFLLYSQCQIKK